MIFKIFNGNGIFLLEVLLKTIYIFYFEEVVKKYVFNVFCSVISSRNWKILWFFQPSPALDKYCQSLLEVLLKTIYIFYFKEVVKKYVFNVFCSVFLAKNGKFYDFFNLPSALDKYCQSHTPSQSELMTPASQTNLISEYLLWLRLELMVYGCNLQSFVITARKV